MSLISFGGLASGLDTNALIDGIMQAERIPLAQLQTRKKDLGAAKDAISSITSKMAALRSAAQALISSVSFSSLKATSSDPSVVSAIAGAPQPGSYTVEVTKIAREQRSYSDPQSSSTTALGVSGTMNIQVGSGNSFQFTIDPADTLTDVASKIAGSGARVATSVVYDGTGYRLQVRGLDLGAANTVQMSGTTLGLANPANTYQSAQDAEFKVDGLPMTRTTNQVTGAVPGLTLALTKENVTSTVTVESDSEALKKKIQALVTAYNDVVAAGQGAAGYGTNKPQVKELTGDSSIRSVLDGIARIISSPVAGTSGKYTTLGSVGLGTDRDGKLKLDEAKLTAALGADPVAVSKLFVEDASIGASGAMKTFMTVVDQLATNESAALRTRKESLEKLTARLDVDAEAIERRLSLYETQLRERFAQLEVIVSKYKTQGGALAGLSNGSFGSST